MSSDRMGDVTFITRKGICWNTSLDFNRNIGRATPAADANRMANMAATWRFLEVSSILAGRRKVAGGYFRVQMVKAKKRGDGPWLLLLQLLLLLSDNRRPAPTGYTLHTAENSHSLCVQNFAKRMHSSLLQLHLKLNFFCQNID